jgi:hypothetical protein
MRWNMNINMMRFFGPTYFLRGSLLVATYPPNCQEIVSEMNQHQGRYQAQVQTQFLCAACNQGGKSRIASIIAAPSSIALLHLRQRLSRIPSLNGVFFSAS